MSKEYEIYLLTNDNHIHLIKPFAYLWNKYSGLPVTIAGFNPPKFLLPKNFNFISLGQQLPASKWSDGLIRLCRNAPPYFILLLEDYWLYDYADTTILPTLFSMMNPGILRIDLAGNRASYSHTTICQLSGYSIIESDATAKYQMSFQAGIWNRDNLLQTLRTNETPWQSEIEGSGRVTHKVLGTSPAIFKYRPVWRSKLNHWDFRGLKREDLTYIYKNYGIIPVTT